MIAPERNEPDLEDIPEPLRKGLEFRWVEDVDEVFDAALEAAGRAARLRRGRVGGYARRSPQATPSER